VSIFINPSQCSLLLNQLLAGWFSKPYPEQQLTSCRNSPNPYWVVGWPSSCFIWPQLLDMICLRSFNKFKSREEAPPRDWWLTASWSLDSSTPRCPRILLLECGPWMSNINLGNLWWSCGHLSELFSELLTQNLHFNKIPRWFAWTCNFEKHCFRTKKAQLEKICHMHFTVEL